MMLAKRLAGLILCRCAIMGQGPGCDFVIKQRCWVLGGGVGMKAGPCHGVLSTGAARAVLLSGAGGFG